MPEKELINNSASQEVNDDTNKKKYDWLFFKPIIIKYVIPVLVFVVAFLISYLLFRKYFYTEYLVGDDAKDYAHFINSGFGKYLWRSPRPITSFFLGLGFMMFGHYAPNLMLLSSLFFAGMIAALYITTREISKSLIISLIIISLAIASRLNWYLYATYLGVMESSALLCMILCIYFSIRLYKNNKKFLLFYLLICMFYSFATYIHERYMFLFMPISVFSIIIIGWRKKNFLFAFIPIFLFIIFLIYRFFVASSTPFIVTGKVSITLNFWTLISNFWHNFISIFTLHETSPALVGILNKNLDSLGHALFIFTSLLSAILFVVGVILCIFFAKNKKKKYLFIGLLLGVYCAIMLAAGSVSPDRVEPRWTYSGQIIIFLFEGMTFKMIADYYKRTDIFGSNFENKSILFKFFSILGLLLYSTPFIGLSFYVHENKQQYYICDDISRSKRYDEQIRKAMKEEGEDKLTAICDKFNYNFLNYAVYQWEDVANYKIFKYDDVDETAIASDDSFICICSDETVSRPLNYSYDNIVFSNYWIEGNSCSLFVNGVNDELYLKLMKVDFQDMPNNKITIKNGNKVVVDQLEIDKDIEIYIPMNEGYINHITFTADYTYCPAEHSESTDTRDLSLYILQLGGHGAEPYVPSYTSPILTNQWVEGKDYSFFVVGDVDVLYLKLMQTHFANMPNNKITIKNGKTIVVDKYEISKDSEFYIPLNEGRNHIHLIADYTYCPAEHGTVSDIRKLSFYILQLGGLGAEPYRYSYDKPFLLNQWAEGKDYSFFVMGDTDLLYLKLMQTHFANMPNNKITIKNGNKVVADQLEIDKDIEIYIPLVTNDYNHIHLIADYTYCPAEHSTSKDTRELSFFILQLGGVSKDPFVSSNIDPIFVSKWMENIEYSFFVTGDIDSLYLRIMKVDFQDMPNNKITIKNGNKVVVDQLEIDKDIEIYIPLDLGHINHITFTADYTYNPSEHGGSDQRNLSLFIAQLGGHN